METPPLVRRALALAAALGFEKSCRPEDGALLHVLAARRGIIAGGRDRHGRGRRCRLDRLRAAAAACRSSRPSSTRTLAARAAELFADDPNVTVARRAVASDACRPRHRSTCSSSTRDDAKDDVDAVVGLLAPGRHRRARRLLARSGSARSERRDAWLGTRCWRRSSSGSRPSGAPSSPFGGNPFRPGVPLPIASPWSPGPIPSTTSADSSSRGCRSSSSASSSGCSCARWRWCRR